MNGLDFCLSDFQQRGGFYEKIFVLYVVDHCFYDDIVMFTDNGIKRKGGR